MWKIDLSGFLMEEKLPKIDEAQDRKGGNMNNWETCKYYDLNKGCICWERLVAFAKDLPMLCCKEDNCQWKKDWKEV